MRASELRSMRIRIWRIASDIDERIEARQALPESAKEVMEQLDQSSVCSTKGES